VADTTFEEARRCPRCELPGKEVGTVKGPRGSSIRTIMCENNRCSWNATTWVVQVNADGSIPPPVTSRPKNFPTLPERSDEAVNSYNQWLLEQTLKGGETRRG